MIRRNPFVTYMEILGALYEEPRGPSRLAQACNINYGRLAALLNVLEVKGLIRKEVKQNQETHLLTDLGLEAYRDWRRLVARFD